MDNKGFQIVILALVVTNVVVIYKLNDLSNSVTPFTDKINELLTKLGIN